jgi:hypothetical protein
MISGARARVGAIAVTAALLPALLVACGGSSDESSATQSGTNTFPQSNEPANLNPADFTTQIDNPYFPLPVGARWEIRVTDQEGLVQHEVITVLDKTKQIADGVTARVVHDVVREDGGLAEVTDDWYAQDKDGNVWYFGEDTAEYENGKVTSREGSWQAGVDGAQAGIVMLAHPEVPGSYRQEYYAGHAEDMAWVVSLDQSIGVPYRTFKIALLTIEWSPLDPEVIDKKFYAAGVGLVAELSASGPKETAQLVSVSP